MSRGNKKAASADTETACRSTCSIVETKRNSNITHLELQALANEMLMIDPEQALAIMAKDPAKAQFAQDGTWTPGTRNRHIISENEWEEILNK